MWALMDHNPQLMEDFTHANVEAPDVSAAARHAAPSSQPAVMVRPCNDPPILNQAAQPGRTGLEPLPDLWASAPGWLGTDSGLTQLAPAPMQACLPRAICSRLDKLAMRVAIQKLDYSCENIAQRR